MTAFDIAAILVVLAALFGQINYHVLRLPTTIGLVVIALSVSLVVLLGDWLTGSHIGDETTALIGEIDFYDAVMNGMLGFLLFAAAPFLVALVFGAIVQGLTVKAVIRRMVPNATLGNGGPDR